MESTTSQPELGRELTWDSDLISSLALPPGMGDFAQITEHLLVSGSPSVK